MSRSPPRTAGAGGSALPYRPAFGLALVASLGLLGSPGAARGEPLPRWEIGVGAGGLSLPDYRGSDQRHDYLLPYPALVYRLDWFRADRNGVRADVFKREWLDLNLSLDASPPVFSDRNAARSGMPDLKPQLALGPGLDLTLWRDRAAGSRLKLNLPLRFAATVSERPQSTGWVFDPRLDWSFRLPAAGPGPWRVGISGGPIYASRRQNAFFYQVDPAYATATRPAYMARAGDAGTRCLGNVSRQLSPDVWIGAYAGWDRLRGAVFASSPLVRRNDQATAGFGVTWTLSRSADRVEGVRDEGLVR